MDEQHWNISKGDNVSAVTLILCVCVDGGGGGGGDALS